MKTRWKCLTQTSANRHHDTLGINIDSGRPKWEDGLNVVNPLKLFEIQAIEIIRVDLRIGEGRVNRFPIQRKT